MLAKVSQRINEILQTQDHPNIVGTPKDQKKVDAFERSRMSGAEPTERANFSDKKDRAPQRNNPKQVLPPKSSNNLFFSPASRSDKELDMASRRSIEKPPMAPTIQVQPPSMPATELFITMYREEILAFVRPLLVELEAKILRRLETIQNQLRAISELQKFSPAVMAPTPIFNPPLKLDSVATSEIEAILQKAQLISSKIEENQLRVVSRFRDIEDQLFKVNRKASEKCSCFNHLESIVEGQNYLCEELKQLKQQQHRRTPST